MKKFKDFITRITKDDFKVNAFYDVGLRVMIIITIIFELSGLFRFLLDKPIYSLLLIDSVIIIIVFFILLIINATKRTKNKSSNEITNKHRFISSLLLFLGVSCSIFDTFSKVNSKTILIIAIVLIIGSIGFYMIGYKQAKKNLHFEKIA